MSAQVVSPSLAATSDTSGLSSSSAALLFLAIGSAILLLALASVPPWAIPRADVAEFLVERRLKIAASGFSTLFAAVIVLVLAPS